jgi:Ras GTPase-activating-like protein IQGAP2/3
MMTLNPFVENNKARINQFLNSLCEVGDFYDTLEVRSLLFSFSMSNGKN